MAEKPRALFPVVVHMALRRGSALFLLHRSNTGFADGWYSLPGGHQELGESVTAAVVRECREETGVEVIHHKPLAVLPYRSTRVGKPAAQGVNFVFLTEISGLEPRVIETDKFDHGDFFAFDHLPDNTLPWVRDLVQRLGDDNSDFCLLEYEWD